MTALEVHLCVVFCCPQDLDAADSLPDDIWEPLPANIKADTILRGLLTFTVIILTTGGTWPASLTNLDAIKVFLMTMILQELTARGFAVIVSKISSVHAKWGNGPRSSRPVNLTVALSDPTSILPHICQLFAYSPLIVNVPGGSYAEVTSGSGHAGLVLRVSCLAPSGNLLSKSISDMYGFIRVSPGGALGKDVVKHVVQQYNKNKSPQLWTDIIYFDSDRSQVILANNSELPGNDYVMVVTGCTILDRRSFTAPIRRICQANLGVAASVLPESRIFTLIRLHPGGSQPVMQRKRVLPPAQSDAGAPVSKRSALHHGVAV